MSYQNKFADALRATMEKKQISQATVARLTSLNSGTISRVLSGKRKNISYETIATIAYKLNMWKGRTPDDLVKRIEELEFKLVNEQNRADSAVRFLRFFIVLSLGLMICLLS